MISTACVKTVGHCIVFCVLLESILRRRGRRRWGRRKWGERKGRQSHQNIFSFLSISFPSHNLPSLVGQNGGWHSFADLNSLCAKIRLHCSLGCHRHLPKKAWVNSWEFLKGGLHAVTLAPPASNRRLNPGWRDLSTHKRTSQPLNAPQARTSGPLREHCCRKQR